MSKNEILTFHAQQGICKVWLQEKEETDNNSALYMVPAEIRLFQDTLQMNKVGELCLNTQPYQSMTSHMFSCDIRFYKRL